MGPSKIKFIIFSRPVSLLIVFIFAGNGALARQLPILYNSEKKAKSVGCKIEDMRSRFCFLYPGILGCL